MASTINRPGKPIRKAKEKPLVDRSLRIQKYPGKGGWTYIAVPGFAAVKKSPFSWRRVRGFIDDYEIKHYHLMPMKSGDLFLPVKAEIRRKIKKQEGDLVRVILYHDETPLEIPDELITCLKDEPPSYDIFLKLSEGYQKEFINWIFAAKKTETRADRIARSISIILQGKTLSR